MAGVFLASGTVIQNIVSSADYIFEEGKDQALIAFRRLPDILLSGSLFMTFMLGWQPALASFAGGILFSGASQALLADHIKKTQPHLVRAGGVFGNDECSGHFPGVSWSRVMTVMRNPKDMTTGIVPGYYMTTLGYILAFVMSQTFVFKDELAMRPATESWMRVFSVIVAIAVFALGILRVVVGCEPWWAATLSALLGIILGLIYVALIVKLFGRRAVNVSQIPLLKKRIPDAKPIYVCAS